MAIKQILSLTNFVYIACIAFNFCFIRWKVNSVFVDYFLFNTSKEATATNVRHFLHIHLRYLWCLPWTAAAQSEKRLAFACSMNSFDVWVYSRQRSKIPYFPVCVVGPRLIADGYFLFVYLLPHGSPMDERLICPFLGQHWSLCRWVKNALLFYSSFFLFL